LQSLPSFATFGSYGRYSALAALAGGQSTCLCYAAQVADGLNGVFLLDRSLTALLPMAPIGRVDIAGGTSFVSR